jgi:hypothetical protein
MREETRHGATEFLKQLYAAGEIDAGRLDAGVAVQVVECRGRLVSRLDPPVPGLPLVRLDVTTNIGTVRLRHP